MPRKDPASEFYQMPTAVRLAARAGTLTAATQGCALGYLQANVMIVPQEEAFDFLLFCQRNPKPCPLIEVLEPGAVEPRCAPGANVATDVPRYRVYRGGHLTEERPDIQDLWRPDLVTFLLGCSFSFEAAMLEAGIRLRHLVATRIVPMFRTNIPCRSAGRYRGEMVVSMRPVPPRLVMQVVSVSARFENAHGMPVHIGDPRSIGISDLSRPDYGEAILLKEDEVPVFWACGVTPQWVAQVSRLPLCITHSPGCMFVTDMKA